MIMEVKLNGETLMGCQFYDGTPSLIY